MKKKVGRFGDFGGQYVPETVMNAVHELEQAYDFYKNDPQFQKELTDLYHNYAGRPSMLYYAEKMTKDLGGAKIYIKREDLIIQVPIKLIMYWGKRYWHKKWEKSV